MGKMRLSAYIRFSRDEVIKRWQGILGLVLGISGESNSEEDDKRQRLLMALVSCSGVQYRVGFEPHHRSYSAASLPANAES